MPEQAAAWEPTSEGPFATASADAAREAEQAPRMSKRVSFAGLAGFGGTDSSNSGQQQQQEAGAAVPMVVDGQQQQQQQQGQTLASFSAAAAAAAAAGQRGGSSGSRGPTGAVTDPKDLEQLMRRMHFRSNKGLGPGGCTGLLPLFIAVPARMSCTCTVHRPTRCCVPACHPDPTPLHPTYSLTVQLQMR